MTKTKKPKSVWALEDGEYSDYHVIGVFSSEKNAETVQKFTGGTIAEWALDPAVGAINKGLKKWRVLMLRDGTTESVEASEISSYNLGDEHHIWERSKAPAYRGTGTPDCLMAFVWARNPNHAVKIVNEIRAGLIAGNKWK